MVLSGWIMSVVLVMRRSCLPVHTMDGVSITADIPRMLE